jgi:hypothetical protein
VTSVGSGSGHIMEIPSALAVFGYVWICVFIPFHTLSIAWFAARRYLFPIVGRISKPTIGLMLFWTPMNLMIGSVFQCILSVYLSLSAAFHND